MPHKISLQNAFAGIDEYWVPRVAGSVNDCHVKLAKFRGAFDWHHHDTEDEMFLVVKGRLRMGFRDGDVMLDAGEFVVVPHGTEHRPEAIDGECHVLLVEPESTVNTGTVVTERTVAKPQFLEGAS